MTKFITRIFRQYLSFRTEQIFEYVEESFPAIVVQS